MRLAEYRRKRDFSRTREPRGAKRQESTHLRFVVQKHDARRLHYDFRLELDGALKSWAVPKGPSLDPHQRRLAVHVEDHPIEYGTFEGRIPEGEYGAGTVLVWDRGTWIPRGEPREMYRRGRLKFTLNGAKLQGGWNLVRMAGRAAQRGKDNWLLIKETDEHARSLEDGDILDERPDSVFGRTARGGRATPARPQAKPHHRIRPQRKTQMGLGDAPKASLPAFIEPELASLVDRPPDGDDWIHEIKLDGYRILTRIERGRARLLTRRNNDWTRRFASLAASLAALPVESALLDGEIVRLDAHGVSSFQALQEALSRKDDAGLIYFAFDILHLNGHDLMRVPLERRKRMLADLLKAAHPDVRQSEHVEGRGEAFYRQACRLALEGVVSKRRESVYQPRRTTDWLKVKCTSRQEFVIGGFTDPEGTRPELGALLLGVYDDAGVLRYAGRVGTGFDRTTLKSLHARLRKLETDTSPFTSPNGAPRRGVHWIQPQLVAEISFSNWTRDGRLRQPSFEGLREDKEAGDVVREQPLRVGASSDRAGRTARSTVKERESQEIAGIRLTHPDRVLYPEQGITKQALALFYQEIADWILPHVVDRPISLVRCPDGYQHECFFQKHANASLPKELERIKTKRIRDKSGPAPYLFVEDLPGLISLVQLGALEIHPWGSRVDRLERPDIVTIDLDPGPDVPWARVVTVADHLRRRLRALDLESFLKTTGGKGLHVVVPLAPKHTWGDVKDFARGLANEIVRLAPDEYTSKVSKAGRKEKVLIDYLRNSRGATAVAAYSTRARAGAPVSTPLRWDELGPAVRANSFTIENLRQRLAGLKKDPWAGYFDVEQSIAPRVRRELGLVSSGGMHHG